MSDNLSILPAVIEQVRFFWNDIYSKSPFMAFFTLVLFFGLPWYAIFIWGGIKRQEKATNESVKADYDKAKSENANISDGNKAGGRNE
ncbi:TPA: hypothetical protein ACHV9H_001234 [Providencia stuartii]|uniref:hypothetical protein n=1 Tax=Providencia stuartii TaxID=588 RepID=UPI0012B5CB06|nr:hypothetical protein [Providencia stuartii]MTC11941.1 hypothetical protein [Providencia stuartii]QPB11301.1 hypothetical protein [Providencia phage PSTNGR2lys]